MALGLKRFVKPLILAAACAAVSAAAQAQTVLRMGFGLPVEAHYGVGAAHMQKLVAERMGGRYRIELFPNFQLGGEREMTEGAQLGTIDLVITSTGPVGNFVPETRIFDIPFLFRDYAHARGLLDSQIGQDLLGRFTARGLVGVVWMENGFRHLTNSRREVNSPADVRGLKVRTMENQVHMRAFTTLGALPTPMAFSELIPALQQGTVDGQENPISVIVANNINQVQKFMTLTNHVYSPSVMICNPGTVGKLSAGDRAHFQEAARAAQKANRDRVSADDASGVEELRRRGMTVVTQVDTASFQTALAPAFAEWERTLDAALLRRIREWKPN